MLRCRFIKQPHRREQCHSAGERGPQAERERLGGRLTQGRTNHQDDGQQRAAESDVDGRARGVRLVPGGVEIAQTKREVDRVDVFKRRSERRKVGRQIPSGDKQRPTPNAPTPNLGAGIPGVGVLEVGSFVRQA